jgi:hypothetical protein
VTTMLAPQYACHAWMRHSPQSLDFVTNDPATNASHPDQVALCCLKVNAVFTILRLARAGSDSSAAPCKTLAPSDCKLCNCF